eukprot:g76726.t1
MTSSSYFYSRSLSSLGLISQTAQLEVAESACLVMHSARVTQSVHAALMKQKSDLEDPLLPSLEDGAASKPKMPSGKVGMGTMTLNLVAIGLGTGVLSQPWGLAGASLLVGMVINGGVLFLNCLTLMLMVEACEKHQEFELGGLLSKLPGYLGRVTEPACNLLIMFSSGGTLITYFIVIYDSLQPYLPSHGPLSNRVCVIVLSAVCILPLCLVDQNYLSFTSTLSMLVNANILLLLFAHLYEHGVATQVCVLGPSIGSLTLFIIIFHSIIVHMCIPPMYAELSDRSPARFRTCLIRAFVVLFLVFSGFAGVGYIGLGPQVSSNLLNSLPDTPWTAATRIAMIACCLSVFPFLMVTLTAPSVQPAAAQAGKEGSPGDIALESPQQAEHSAATPNTPGAGLFFKLIGLCSKAGCARALRTNLGATVFWMTLVAVVSFFVRDLGFVNVINGAASVAGFVGIVPCLVGLYLLDGYQGTRKGRCLMYGLLVFCLVSAALGFVYTDNQAQQLLDSCWWWATK